VQQTLKEHYLFLQFGTGNKYSHLFNELMKWGKRFQKQSILTQKQIVYFLDVCRALCYVGRSLL